MRLAAPILMKRFEEEMCKAHIEEDHHDQTTNHWASLSQQSRRSSDFIAGGQRKGPSNTLEQKPTAKVIGATKPSLISIVIAAQATTRKTSHHESANYQPQCHVHPAQHATWEGARSSR
jgi:hypothetical protein